MDISELQNAAIEAATKHIRNQREENRLANAKVCLLAALACTLAVCFATVACFAIYQQQETIREQQYALNAQYAQLMEYVSGAEVTTVTESYEASADDGGTAVAGNNNTTTIGG